MLRALVMFVFGTNHLRFFCFSFSILVSLHNSVITSPSMKGLYTQTFKLLASLHLHCANSAGNILAVERSGSLGSITHYKGMHCTSLLFQNSEKLLCPTDHSCSVKNDGYIVSHWSLIYASWISCTLVLKKEKKKGRCVLVCVCWFCCTCHIFHINSNNFSGFVVSTKVNILLFLFAVE